MIGPGIEGGHRTQRISVGRAAAWGFRGGGLPEARAQSTGLSSGRYWSTSRWRWHRQSSWTDPAAKRTALNHYAGVTRRTCRQHPSGADGQKQGLLRSHSQADARAETASTRDETPKNTKAAHVCCDGRRFGAIRTCRAVREREGNGIPMQWSTPGRLEGAGWLRRSRCRRRTRAARGWRHERAVGERSNT